MSLPLWPLRLLLCLALGATGCASSAPPAASVLRVRDAGAPSYTSEPTAGAVRATAHPDELRDAVERGAAVAHRALIGDGRLAAIAQAALRADGGEASSVAVLAEFHARHLGLSDTGLQLVLLPRAPLSQLTEALAQAVFLRVADRPVTHYGVAFDDERLALLLSRRGAALEPIPRHIDVGTPIAVRGTVAVASGPVQVEYVDPDGRRHRLPVARADGLHVRVPTERAGRYVVEVVAGLAGQQEVLARMPIYAGVAPPQQLSIRPRAGAPQLGKVASELRRMLDHSRHAAQLPSLSALPSLTALAVHHAIALRDRAFVGYGPPSPRTPIERVREAGFGTGLVLDNTGRGMSAADLHARFAADAGLRRNMLSPELTHVGIGVVAGVGGELIASAVFLRMTGWVDVVAGRARLLDSINTARSGRGVPPLVSDPDLAAIAQESALRFFEPPFPDEQATVALANRHLDRLAIAYRRVAAVMATADDLGEVSALEPALEADATHVGIGLSQGDHPRAGSRRLAAVLTIGYGR